MAVNIIPVASASKLEKEALKKNEKKQLSLEKELLI